MKKSTISLHPLNACHMQRDIKFALINYSLAETLKVLVFILSNTSRAN